MPGDGGVPRLTALPCHEAVTPLSRVYKTSARHRSWTEPDSVKPGEGEDDSQQLGPLRPTNSQTRTPFAAQPIADFSPVEASLNNEFHLKKCLILTTLFGVGYTTCLHEERVARKLIMFKPRGSVCSTSKSFALNKGQQPNLALLFSCSCAVDDGD
ncbi:hypothetical protein J6590_019676 [Homalodisca vitripennis]|nr:hypothetical protein J6590_019676 [Homalodisca vitripennis]